MQLLLKDNISFLMFRIKKNINQNTIKFTKKILIGPWVYLFPIGVLEHKIYVTF